MEDKLKYVANDVARLVGDLVVFAGDRLTHLSEEDKTLFTKLCDQLDSVQARLDAFAQGDK
jgi:hypothetical protein